MRTAEIQHLADDARTIDTTKIHQRYSILPNAHWHRNRTNLGPIARSTRSAAHFQTPYFALQDSDDIAHPHRIWKSIRALEQSSADIFASAMQRFRDESEPEPDLIYSTTPTNQSWAILNGTMTLRTHFFRNLNGFADLFCGADSEFIIRAYQAGGKFIISREPLVQRRLHAGSLTQSPLTGFKHAPAGSATQAWESDYRRSVRREIERRRLRFLKGDCDWQSYGCLNPELSRTLDCVPDPK